MNRFQEQTGFQLIGNAFKAYFYNLPLLLIPLLLISIPSQYFSIRGQMSGDWKLILTGIGISNLISPLYVILATTILMDWIQGKTPSISGFFERLSIGLYFRVLIVTILFLLSVMIGAVFCIVPGFLFFAWFLVVTVVVVAEDTGIFEAFGRSKELGRGFYLRNLGITLLTVVLLIAPGMIINYLFGVQWVNGLPIQDPKINILTSLLLLPFAPVFATLPVMIYNDMKIRKSVEETVPEAILVGEPIE